MPDTILLVDILLSGKVYLKCYKIYEMSNF